jgi:hypothetical protein
MMTIIDSFCTGITLPKFETPVQITSAANISAAIRLHTQLSIILLTDFVAFAQLLIALLYAFR